MTLENSKNLMVYELQIGSLLYRMSKKSEILQIPRIVYHFSQSLCIVIVE